MGIQLNEKLVVANTQTIKFDEAHITGGETGNLNLLLSFVVLDENGKRIDTKVVKFEGNEYNEFWKGFSTGKFCYEQLVAKENLDIVVTNDVEKDFLNVEKEVEQPKEEEPGVGASLGI